MKSYISRGRRADIANPLRGLVDELGRLTEVACPRCGSTLELLRSATVDNGERQRTADVVACCGCEFAVVGKDK